MNVMVIKKLQQLGKITLSDLTEKINPECLGDALRFNTEAYNKFIEEICAILDQKHDYWITLCLSTNKTVPNVAYLISIFFSFLLSFN